MSGRFGTLPNGAVYQESDLCTCYGGEPGYGHEPHCGHELIGFLPVPEGANPAGTVFDFVDPDLLPSMLWDFSGVDYSTGPYAIGVAVSAPA